MDCSVRRRCRGLFPRSNGIAEARASATKIEVNIVVVVVILFLILMHNLRAIGATVVGRTTLITSVRLRFVHRRRRSRWRRSGSCTFGGVVVIVACKTESAQFHSDSSGDVFAGPKSKQRDSGNVQVGEEIFLKVLLFRHL